MKSHTAAVWKYGVMRNQICPQNVSADMRRIDIYGAEVGPIMGHHQLVCTVSIVGTTFET